MNEDPKCDFCSARPVAWGYPCRDFIHTPPAYLRRWAATFHSPDEWLACQRCHELIQSGNRSGLAERSARTHPARKQLPLGVLRKICRGLQDDFWKNREGDPQPVA